VPRSKQCANMRRKCFPEGLGDVIELFARLCLTREMAQMLTAYFPFFTVKRAAV